MREVFNDVGIHILEAPPQCRMVISYIKNSEYVSSSNTFIPSLIKKNLYVSLPYVQYFMVNDALFATMKNEPMTDWQDTNLKPCFDGRMWKCLYYDQIYKENYNLKHLIKLYWSSPFGVTVYDETIKSYEQWAEETKKNPNFGIEHNWKSGRNYELGTNPLAQMCRYTDYAHLSYFQKDKFFGMSLENRVKIINERSLQQV
jgi:hypothetical protein